MNSCIIIHRTGDTEMRDVQPVVHQQLRGLGYRRFVLKFIRALDGRAMTSAIYSHLVPSPWQASTAAEQLFGRARGSTRLFDDDGHELHGEPEPGLEVAPVARATPVATPVQPATSPLAATATAPASGAAAAGAAGAYQRIAVRSNDHSIIAQCRERTDLPLIRISVRADRGWVVEVSVPTSDGRGTWVELELLKGANGEP